MSLVRHARMPHPVPDDVGATVSLALYSAAVAAGFARVFAGWQFLDNLLVLVVVGHGLSFLLRRGRVAGWIAVPLVALVLAWTIGAMHYRFTHSSLLLPTWDTWHLFTGELDLVRDQFRTAVAPVIYGGGWDVLASIGVAGSVLLADAFAFRAYARAEALVPGGVLFVFVAALGDDRDRVPLTVALIAAGVLTTVMLRAYHSGRISSIGGRRTASALALPGAVGAAIVLAVSAGLVGPALPGANAEPIYDTTEGGSGPSAVDNPLVDIRARLTNRSNTEMFVVRSNASSYWRSTALAEFDGRRWRIPERELQTAEGVLGTGTSGVDLEIRQNLLVVNLGGSFVPSAPDPVRQSGPPDIELRWIEQDATLFARDHTLTAGDEFDIVSARPLLNEFTLSESSSSDAGDPIYLDLPDDFPDLARDLAREVTAGAASSYEAAILLQDWFRSEFDYSLEAQSGHGSNAIESFLRERVGYCEQFAGAYAAMLRSLGIPTRVAVGFTSGIEQSPGTYSVRGKNAHAWPEVWFDDYGWVLFEPTPGRGAPGAEGYTSVAPAQDDSTSLAPEEAVAEDAETPPPTSAPTEEPFDPSVLGDDFLDTSGAGGLPEEPVDAPSSGGLPVLPVLGLLALIAVAPAVSRWFARRRPSSAESQLARYWKAAMRSLEDVGVRPRPGSTPIETAAEAGDRFPIVARPTRSLANAVTEATYRAGAAGDLDVPGSYGHSTIRDCASWSRQIERATTDSMSYPARVLRYFTRWS